MNSLEILAKELELEIPDAQIALDKPLVPSGTWYLDINRGDRNVVVAWRPEKPFGISTPDSVEYGEGSHEVWIERLMAANRVLELLRSGAKTSATRHAVLGDVRRARKVSQSELAKKLQIEQGAISKFENRRDVQVGTIFKVIDTLGGKFEMYAHFPDESFRIIPPGSPRITRNQVQIFVEATDPRTKKRRGKIAIPAKSEDSPLPYECYFFVIDSAGNIEGKPFGFKNTSSVTNILRKAERRKMFTEYKWETLGEISDRIQKK